MRNGVELIIDEPLNTRAERFMRSLALAAPTYVKTSRSYTASARTIVVYGPGAPARQKYIRSHALAGGRTLLWDMGYWDRVDSMRLALDTLHPTARQLMLCPSEGTRRNFELREDASPDGPIMLVGLGVKTNVALRTSQHSWEQEALAKIRKRWPDRKVLWRPKGKHPEPLGKLPISHGNPIAEALRGCSAVVCRHSNVAVDACVAGVPVYCDDGAAFALYEGNPEPTREQRAEFLRRLSWWEWNRAEAREAWDRMTFLVEATGGGIK